MMNLKTKVQQNLYVQFAQVFVDAFPLHERTKKLNRAMVLNE